MMREPKLVEFPKLGSSILGYISVAEGENVPFAIERVYWTYYTPENVERGGHAHLELEQILIAVAGRIVVDLELFDGQRFTQSLDTPNQGLYIPRLTWREMRYSHNAVQLCLASCRYSESDYIRDYNQFLKLKERQNGNLKDNL